MKNYYLKGDDLMIFDTETKELVVLERIRTVRVVTVENEVHIGEPSTGLHTGKRKKKRDHTAVDDETLTQRVKRMKSEGMSAAAIAIELKIGTAGVYYHLNKK